MFDQFWKNALFTIFFGMLGGFIVISIFAVLHNRITDVGSWADWFGAIGTIGAVIVSLYFSNKRPRPDLEAVFNENVMINIGGNNFRNLMSWEIKNYSNIPTSITLVGAIVSEKKKVNKKSKIKNFMILKPIDIFRTHRIPIDVEAYAVETILYEFEGIQQTLEEETKWQSITFFCKDNFDKYYYSSNYQTKSLLQRMKKRTILNDASA
ncbi:MULTISPECIES: hypothetical protein [Leuconostoc]|uniref:hypothetical protein n=1 Tax=Leuconostoc TaxID=1243 RepID=UPI0009FF3276|nr:MULTISPECIES: hypothetical protein [Leuconostoc]ORI80688.1 hypothetical protein BMS92_04195 [Leuconostoc mesenteroides subsp. mesenteroides]